MCILVELYNGKRQVGVATSRERGEGGAGSAGGVQRAVFSIIKPNTLSISQITHVALKLQ